VRTAIVAVADGMLGSVVHLCRVGRNGNTTLACLTVASFPGCHPYYAVKGDPRVTTP
jgi:hypothetical protein